MMRSNSQMTVGRQNSSGAGTKAQPAPAAGAARRLLVALLCLTATGAGCGGGDEVPRPADAVDPVRRFAGHTYFVHSIAFSPDGTRLVSVSEDKSMRVWDVASGRELRRWACDGSRGVVFLPDGRRAVTTGDILSPPHVWDVESGESKPAFPEREGHETLALSPDGKTIAFAGGDRCRIDRFSVKDGRPLAPLTDAELPEWPPEALRGIAFAPDGRTIVGGGSGDHKLRFWDTASGRLVRTIDCPGGDWPHTLAYSPDGRLLLAGGSKASYVWDVATGRLVATVPRVARGNWTALFTHDGARVVCGDGLGPELWNIDVSGAGAGGTTRVATFWDRACSANCLAVSPDGRHLAAAGGHGTYTAGRFAAGGFDICLWELPKPAAASDPAPAR